MAQRAEVVLVEDLSVEDVLTEEQLVVGQFGGRKQPRGDTEGDRAALERLHKLPRHTAPATAPFRRDESGYQRVHVVESESEIGNAAKPAAIGAEHVLADVVGQ